METEEKAKRYDETIKRAKGVIEQNPLMEYLKKGIEYIFPELKENEDEDEKIRKALIRTFNGKRTNEHINGVLVGDILTWLEKQHMQKQETSYPKFDFDDILALQCCMETAEKVTEDKELYEKLKSLHSRLHDAYWLEKQGEQKQDPCDNCKDVMLNCHNFPCTKKRAFKQGKSVFDIINEEQVDKVEPKFKIKYAGNEYNVLEVKDIAGVTFYGIEDEPNHIDYIKAENCERVDGYNIKESGSLYPTKSAMFSKQNPIDKVEQKFKDGDVLNSPSHYLIWIYKDNEHFYACVNMNYVTGNVATNGLIKIPSDACPATKEQRDTLMKAMADAGYAFDFDKKKLKKMVAPKFKIGDTMRTSQEASNGITSGLPVIVSIDNEYYHCNNELIAIKNQDNYEYPPMNRRQKPAWSNKDKKILDELITFFEKMVLPKDHDFQIYASWLKSLKDRCTWRPSDEQMKAFENFVKSIGESGYASPYENNTKLLYSLLEQLKKLK